MIFWVITGLLQVVHAVAGVGERICVSILSK